MPFAINILHYLSITPERELAYILFWKPQDIGHYTLG